MPKHTSDGAHIPINKEETPEGPEAMDAPRDQQAKAAKSYQAHGRQAENPGPDGAGGAPEQPSPETAEAALELTDEELLALCQARICPGCSDEANAERLRALAEMDNFKKRLQREHEDLRKYVGENILGDIIPALDNLDLAIQHAGDDPAVQNLRMGVEMTRKLMLDSLSRHGLAPVGAVGEAFDPALHEAVGQAEAEGVEPGHVAQVMQRGYTLHERLLRPAKVMVQSGA